MSTTPPTTRPDQHSDFPPPSLNNNSIPVRSKPTPLPTASPKPTQTQQPCRFLDLSVEIRLQIYNYLLPPQHHIVTTRIPSNPFFYNSSFSPSSSSSPSLYPFGKQAPRSNISYSVTSTPPSSLFSPREGNKLEIFPEILRVSKAIKEEAEPILYGHPDVTWDFGLGFEGLPGFLGQRSELGRSCVRRVRGAACVTRGMDSKFLSILDFMRNELGGVQNIEFTIWGEQFGGGAEGGEKYLSSLASRGRESGEIESGEGEGKNGWNEREWREWGWTRGFFELEGLRKLIVREWTLGERGEKGRLDGWLARHMIVNGLVRDRMFKEGAVVERCFAVCL